MDLAGFAAYARMTPAQQVGGDFVDVFESSEGQLFFSVCDVSGKGVAAALFMAVSQGTINAAATKSQNGGVGAIATEANRLLCSENPMGLFVTGMLAIVGRASEMEMVNHLTGKSTLLTWTDYEF